MVRVASLPPCLVFERAPVGHAAMKVAFAGERVLLAAGQYGVHAALASLDLELEASEERLLASGAAADYQFAHLLALPDGQVLLCRSPDHDALEQPIGNLRVDPKTLATSAATQWQGQLPAGAWTVSEMSVTPRLALLLQGRLLLAHGARYISSAGTGWWTRSDLAASHAEPFLSDLGKQLVPHGYRSYGTWHTLSAVVLDDQLFLLGHMQIKGGARDHSLLRIDAEGQLLGCKRLDNAVVDAPQAVLVADAQRGLLWLAAKGRVLLFDPDMNELADAGKHTFCRTHALLGADPHGRLLWRAVRKPALLLSQAEDLSLATLDRDLDALAAASKRGSGEEPRSKREPQTPPDSARRSIERHKIIVAWHAKLDAEHRVDLLSQLQSGSSANLGMARLRAQYVFATAAVLTRDDPMLLTAVRTLAQTRTAQLLCFRQPAAPDQAERVEVPFADGSITQPTCQRDIEVRVPYLRDTWYLALMARDAPVLDALQTVPEERLTHGYHNPHDLAWLRCLRAFRADPPSALALASEAIALPTLRTERAEARVRMAVRAVYPLLAALCEGDADRFNDALFNALDRHRKVYGLKSQAQAWQGWTCWGATAMCCLAYDRGVPIRIDSDYLLPALIEHRFAVLPE